MSKISITGLEARNKAVKGMSYVAGVVRETIGPFGLNALLEKGNKITNDGYTIASELAPTIKDEFERRGALVAQDACSKTNDQVGDFSSTAWALTEAIVKEAIRYLPNEKSIKAKKTYSEVAKMIEDSKEKVIAELDLLKTPIESKESLIKSALVSVEDEELANLIGGMQWELGPEGVIIAEEVNETKSSIEKVTGIRLDNGFGASHLVTDPEKQSLEVRDVPILLTNYTIGVEELKIFNDSILKHLITQKKLGLVIVARAFTSEAIKMCQESTQAGFALFPINAPYVNQTEIMHDIETIVGGRYIDVEESNLDEIYITDIGFVKRLIARQMDAVVTGVDDEQSQKRKDTRVEFLKKKLSGSQSDFEKRMIESRIAQLCNGFAILKVGSHSITNRKRLKDKADDAVNSVRMALQGGTVRGAGIALKEISDKMDDTDILKRPLTCVYDQITSSAPEGWEIPEWVRDPFLGLKVALENACDFAATFASTNAIVTTENPKECCHDKKD
jgi:chaperonin GroEL